MIKAATPPTKEHEMVDQGHLDPPQLLTLGAPSFPADAFASMSPSPLAPGASIGDFHLLAILGQGGAGTVYLARDQTLERNVALKVCHDTGSEAQTMANLEHPHIVKVFSETVDPVHQRRMLCMQYVPGTTLAALIHQLKDLPLERRDGQAILSAIDSLNHATTILNAEELRDRETLSNDDALSAICRLGAQIADALAHAHHWGVLHRDIKPANILINPYGRPLLTDFGLASFNARGGQDQPFGGTLGFMAPEHLAAFQTREQATIDAVDERSDIYSLGVVLYQWLTGQLPFEADDANAVDTAAVNTAAVNSEQLAAMDHGKKRPVHELWPHLSSLPQSIAQTILRCLEPHPDQRFQSAADLAAALRGCLWILQAERAMPAAGRLTEAISHRQFAAGVAASFWPHLIGAVLCPAYLLAAIGDQMTGAQVRGLVLADVIFSAIMFPLASLWVYWKFRPAFRMGAEIRTRELIAAGGVDRKRQLVVSTPTTSLAMTCCIWAQLLLVFPLTSSALGHPFGWYEWAHFVGAILFGLSTAASYTFLMLQYSVVRCWYLQFFIEPANAASLARAELSGVLSRSRTFVFLASLSPLLAAISLIAIGPEAMGVSGYLVFRIFGVGLVLLGASGFIFSLQIFRIISDSLQALTEQPPRG